MTGLDLQKMIFDRRKNVHTNQSGSYIRIFVLIKIKIPLDEYQSNEFVRRISINNRIVRFPVPFSNKISNRLSLSFSRETRFVTRDRSSAITSFLSSLSFGNNFQPCIYTCIHRHTSALVTAIANRSIMQK